jgi:putative transposase
VDTLCELFGKSRQAYYQQKNRTYQDVIKEEVILDFVKKQRKMMPRLGGRKLHHNLQVLLPESFHMGRDAFFDLLRENQFLIRRRRYKVKTTDSNHWLHKYPNLIREFTPERPNQLWVSDITYVETKDGFSYLFLITDAYSRKIIGWYLGDTLEAKHAVKALFMALWQLPEHVKELIHHSDRGVQYCCDAYVKILKKRGIKISMTENGDPLENAIAERINGILKTEWIYDLVPEQVTNTKIKRIIETYNAHRPHQSIDMLTPIQAHMGQGSLKRLWKNYYVKYPTEVDG